MATSAPVVAAQTAPAATPAPSQSPSPRALVPLTEAALQNGEYTVCGEKVRLKDNQGVTNKAGLDYERQCKTGVARSIFGDLNGDRLDDAVVILYTFERSHRIPSIHAVVNDGGQPREVSFEELPWEREVTEVTLVDHEARVTLSAGPGAQAPDTIRVELLVP
jgi:hypothetical protein